MTMKPDDNDDLEDRKGVVDDGDYGAFDFILENNVRSVMSWEADGKIKEEKENSYSSNCNNNDDVVDENKNDNKIDEKGNNKYNDREYTYSTECARRIWGAIDAGRDLEDAKSDVRHRCHLRYYGFLGSIPNLDYVYNHHVPKTCHSIRVRETEHDGDCVRNNNSAMESLSQCSISTTPMDTVRGCIQYDNAVFPFPLSKDSSCLEKKGKKNMEEKVKDEGKENSQKEKNEENNKTNKKHETKDIIVKPILLSDSKKEKNKMEIENDINTSSSTKQGGTAIWGAYAYWISRDGHNLLINALRKDVGALFWRGKRMKTYVVKPIDKVMPRQILTAFIDRISSNSEPNMVDVNDDNNECDNDRTIQNHVEGTASYNDDGANIIQVALLPSFFRAPMLTSTIHSKWDAEFCRSTEFQIKTLDNYRSYFRDQTFKEKQEQQICIKQQNLRQQQQQQQQHHNYADMGCPWEKLWLPDDERRIVRMQKKTGKWMDMKELEEQAVIKIDEMMKSVIL